MLMLKDKPIYLDYMATTPVDPLVIEHMLKYMGPESNFGNSASVTHGYGINAREAIESARSQIAEVIHANPSDIIFTSGATESNNLAIIGAARFYQRKGRHIITLATEHKAVLDSFKELAKEGFEVTYLIPEEDGILDLNQLKKALREDTILVSVMHVNNEIGVIQDIKEIGNMLSGLGIIFHVDAAQSVGKLPINLKGMNIDLMSFSAHKSYGPKGVGALYVRSHPRIRLQPQSFGGGQEKGLRSGTLPTHQIVGMGEAFVLADKVRDMEQARILKLRDELWSGISHLPGIQFNGHKEKRVAGSLNVSFCGFDGISVIPFLEGIAVSTTSACNTTSAEGSYVLRALGVNRACAVSSVRFALGRYTTEEDIKRVIDIIISMYRRIS